MQTKTFRIAVLPGDGIGPEVMTEATRVLRAVGQGLREVSFLLDEMSVGAGEYLRSGDPLPSETREWIHSHDAILLGPWGCPTSVGLTDGKLRLNTNVPPPPEPLAYDGSRENWKGGVDAAAAIERTLALVVAAFGSSTNP